MNSNDTLQNYKVGFGEKVAFGVGDLAINFVWASIGLFIVYFYTDVVGISPGVVGILMLVSRIWYGVSDVIMGVIVDRTDTKYGKARPWILYLAIPFGISTILLFTIPQNFSDVLKIVYIFITYNLMVIMFTGVVIPYGTLNTFITRDINERSKLNLYRMFFAHIGGLIVGTCTLPLVKAYGNTQTSWAMAYGTYSVIGVILFLITFKYTRERVGSISSTTRQKVSISESLKSLLKNKYWIIIFAYSIVQTIGIIVANTSTVYYAKYIFGDESIVKYFTVTNLVPIILAVVFLMPFLVEKYGKRNVGIMGRIISIISTLIIVFAGNNFTIVMIGSIIRGFSASFHCAAGWAFFSDIIEYGEWKNGIRNEGVIYFAGSFGQKFGSGIAAALFGWILTAFGYQANAEAVSSGTIFAIKFLFLYLPILADVVQIILLYFYKFFYKLDKLYPQIIKELQERNLQNN